MPATSEPETSEPALDAERAWEAVCNNVVAFSMGMNQYSDFRNHSSTLQEMALALLIHDIRRMPKAPFVVVDPQKTRDRLKNKHALSGAVLINDMPYGFAPADWEAPNKVRREFPADYDGRKKNLYDANVDRIEGPICFDLDDGGLADAEARCREMGIAACAYSTYNHSVTKEKARLVIFLSESILTRTPEQAQAYSEFYDALGEVICNNKHDTSCRNVARVIYLPANDGVSPKFARFTPGGLTIPGRFWRKSARRYTQRGPRVRGSGHRGQRARSKSWRRIRGGQATYATGWLPKFLAKFAERFNAADFLKKYPVGRKALRKPMGGAASHCPFGHEHTGEINKSDAMWARNAEGSRHGVFVFECAHKTCKERRTAALLGCPDRAAQTGKQGRDCVREPDRRGTQNSREQERVT